MISSSSNAGANRRSTAVYPSSIPRILYHQRAAKKGREVIKSTPSDRHQISDPGSQIGSLADIRSSSSAASTTNRSTLSAYKGCTLHLYPWRMVISPQEARRLLRLRHMAIATPEARKRFSRTHVWRSPLTSYACRQIRIRSTSQKYGCKRKCSTPWRHRLFHAI